MRSVPPERGAAAIPWISRKVGSLFSAPKQAIGLKSGAVPDDVSDMRGTLSHRSPPDGRARLVAELGLLLVAGVVTMLLIGCADEAPPPSLDVLRQAKPAPTEKADEFAWPADPSHPVIEVQVATPEQEGTILIELMPELAPATVVNVIDLANEGYYDGTTFHRVIPGFMIQGGDPKSRDRDPTNDGTGGGENPLPDEFSSAPYLRGVVGMGNRGRSDSTSAQFFIMHAENRNLDGRYNTIGRVLAGMEFVDEITRVAIDRSGRWGPKDRPIKNVTIQRVRPVGQVAAFRSAMQLEREAGGLELADLDTTPPAEAASAPPAAPSPDASVE